MKTVLIAVFCFGVALALPHPRYVPACDRTKCELPKCQCSTPHKPPISGPIPQFVVLSFDDAARADIYDAFIEKQFVNRKNADGCPISGTFFLPHEYTNYEVVNRLYNKGFEIASQSVTKHSLQEYWDKATIDTTIREMDGQRTILSNFAHIPKSNITGARIPQLRINKNTFEALHQAGFAYDNSWPTMESRPYFPYTLDYASNQQCLVFQCQSVSTPGLWEIPINDWVSQDGVPCNNIDACVTYGTENDILGWMKKNFYEFYEKERNPFHLRVSYAWYISRPEHSIALEKFLDHLGSIKDVHVVSAKQLLNWSRNPSEKFNSCQAIPTQECDPSSCSYEVNGLERIMVVCDQCPNEYPTLDNVLGK